jgi:RNA polymerase sigma factor (sigma-70 family)
VTRHGPPPPPSSSAKERGVTTTALVKLKPSQKYQDRPAATDFNLGVVRQSSMSRITHTEELELGSRLAERRRELLALALHAPESSGELHRIQAELEIGALRLEDILDPEQMDRGGAREAFDSWREAALAVQRQAASLWPSLDPEAAPSEAVSPQADGPRAVGGRRAPEATASCASAVAAVSDERVEQQIQRSMAVATSLPLSGPIVARLVRSVWPESLDADADEREIETAPRPLPPVLQRRARRAQADMERIRSRFVTANQGLVSYVSQRYRGMGLSHDDLMQEGNIGLLRAIEKFDHRRGGRFGTYAVWWIRQGVRRALANQSRTIRIPVHALGTRYTLDQTAKQLAAQLGRQPTEQELAQATGVVQASVTQLMGLVKEPLSLDAPRGPENDSSLGESLADIDVRSAADQALSKQQAQHLHGLLEVLTPREQQMLRMRFGLDGSDECTLEQIGRTFAVTRERVRQIVGAALERLHRQTQLRQLEL